MSVAFCFSMPAARPVQAIASRRVLDWRADHAAVQSAFALNTPATVSAESILADIFRDHFGAQPASVTALRAHGSERAIYRLHGGARSVIGVRHADRAENRAFLSFSRHFRAERVPVPEILAVAPDELAYLEEDLGDTTLFEMLLQERPAGTDRVAPAVEAVYEKAVRWLPEIQVRAGRGIDDAVCHPRARFDRQSMRWDLNYFKYYFLKPARIPFNEQELENDFETFTNFLLQARDDFFLYRDFQSRNIMVRDGEPWFIDYQGGRRGALQYDLASLLVDAKANLPPAFRAHLIDVYLAALAAHVPVDRDAFLAFFDGFTLIRILQAMGAYGYRGYYERKTHFLQSVPYAVRNLELLLAAGRLPVALPALSAALRHIVQSSSLRQAPAEARLPLTVRVESFSYRKGLPADTSGHGGGFVFDCRLLPNPGREVQFAKMAGDEATVVAWLEAREEVRLFVSRVAELVAQAVESYRERNFTNLTVAFGCTGGQHRSVYCAAQLARALEDRGGVVVVLQHRDVVRGSTP